MSDALRLVRPSASSPEPPHPHEPRHGVGEAGRPTRTTHELEPHPHHRPLAAPLPAAALVRGLRQHVAWRRAQGHLLHPEEWRAYAQARAVGAPRAVGG
jgi:hypothetical protein